MARRGPQRTLGEQLIEMRRVQPSFSCRLHRNMLVCTGTLCPTPISDEFTVQIQYDLNRRPRVYVLQPLLKRTPTEKIPHTFWDGSLCLHMPGEWERWMTIAETIVPWAALWLYYYELWRITEKWLGGGHEPGARKHE